MGKKIPTLAKQIIRTIHAFEEGGGSRRQLALKAGVSEAQLSNLVRGIRPSLLLVTAEKIADALGCEIVLRRKSS